MSQSEIILFLKENDGWYSTKQLSEKTGCSLPSIIASCIRLKKRHSVKFILDARGYRYSYKEEEK